MPTGRRDCVLNEPFWVAMMSYGQEIPGYEDIPDEIGQAVAARIARDMESRMSFTEGKAVAAYVLLALKKKAPHLLGAVAARNLCKLYRTRRKS